MTLDDFEKSLQKSLLDSSLQTLRYEQTAVKKKRNLRVTQSERLRTVYAIFRRQHEAQVQDAKYRLQHLLRYTYDAEEQLAVMRLVYKHVYNYDINREYVKKKEFERKIYELYAEEKMTIKEIAQALNLRYEKVRLIIRKYDRKTRKYERVTDVEIEFIKQFLRMNATMYAIAKALNRNVSTVFYAIKRIKHS